MKNISVGFILLIGCLAGCSDEQPSLKLEGTWIDTESQALQFLEFSSPNRGSYGLYAKNFEQHEYFTYRLFDNKIAIDFDNGDSGETIHNLVVADGTMTISDFTHIPENPLKTYSKQGLKTEKSDNYIILGKDDVYFDFENGYRITASVIGDSRCPDNAMCVWAGSASARFTLIGSSGEHTFDLFTGHLLADQKSDIIINNLRYSLMNITPYPKLGKEYKPEDYKVILLVTAVTTNN